MNKNNILTFSFISFTLLSSSFTQSSPSALFYGLSSYLVPLALGANNAKNNPKFFGVTRSKLGFGDVSGFKVNTDQFNSSALDTRSYDESRLLFNMAIPFVVAIMTRCAALPVTLFVRDFLYKAPVRVMRGSINGGISILAMATFSGLQKDPKFQELLKETKTELGKVKSNLQDQIK